MKDIVTDLINGLIDGSVSLDEMTRVFSFPSDVQLFFKNKLLNLEKLTAEDDKTTISEMGAVLGIYMIKQGFLPDNNDDQSLREFQQIIVDRGIEVTKESVSTLAEHTLHATVESISHCIPLVGTIGFIAKYASLRSSNLTVKKQRDDLKMALNVDGHRLLGVYNLLVKANQYKLSNLEHKLEDNQHDPLFIAQKSALLNRWSKEQAYIHHYLRKNQNCLAQLDMNEQIIDRQKKTQVGKAVVSTAAVALHFLGPIGAAVGMPIAGLGQLFVLVSKEYQKNSAMFNHLVLPEHDLSLEYGDLLARTEMLDKVRCVESAVIKFRPPTIDVSRKLSVAEKIKSALTGSNLRSTYQIQDICDPKFAINDVSKTVINKYFLSQHHETTCLLPVYDIPKLDAIDRKNLSAVDYQLLRLAEEQNQLQKITLWYTALMQEMVNHTKSGKDICPYVENLMVIQAQLKAKHESIKVAIDELYFPENYEEISESGKNSLDSIRASQTVTLVQLKQFDAVKTELESLTPYRPEDIATMAINDPDSPEYLTRMLDNELRIQFMLDTLERVVASAQALGQGRHVVNAGALLSEARQLLGDIPDTIKSPDDKAKIISFIELIEVRALQTEEARFQYLNNLHASHPEAFDAIDLQRELTSMLVNLRHYKNPPGLLLQKIEKRIASIPEQEIIKALSSSKSMVLNHFAEDYVPMVFASRNPDINSAQLLENMRTIDPDTGSKKYPPVIQIFPGLGIDNQALVSTRNDERKLANLLEGLKKELKWVANICEECDNCDIKIANLDLLVHHYQQQCELVLARIEHLQTLDNSARHVVVHTENIVTHSLAQAGNALTNLRKVGVVFQNAQNEIDECVKVLIALKEKSMGKLEQAMRQEIQGIRKSIASASAMKIPDSQTSLNSESPAETDSSGDSERDSIC